MFNSPKSSRAFFHDVRPSGGGVSFHHAAPHVEARRRSCNRRRHWKTSRPTFDQMRFPAVAATSQFDRDASRHMRCVARRARRSAPRFADIFERAHSKHFTIPALFLR
ncbi:hypothetical protein C7S17_4382 [Burkholderia thailandensis]|nr:hypothetical protein [Burkholderia thailandensis]